MLSFLPHPIRGALCGVLLGLNTMFWAPLLYPLALLKMLNPSKRWRNWCTGRMVWIAESWTVCNNMNFGLMHRTRWDIRLPQGLRLDRSYLICANHQGWLDIMVLQKIFTKQIPFLRFFLKQELIWIPLLGGAFWALDFPFMRRYSKTYLEKHPEKRGEDLATTRKACERFAGSPISIINFLEGTRRTAAKHEASGFAYRHLLPPKTGGIAFVLEAMGRQFDSLLDVTIYYPQKSITFWSLLSGKIDEIVIHVERVAIPEEFLSGRYLDDPVYRDKIQAWVRDLWIRKDRRLEELART